MAINKEVREELKKKFTNLTPRRINQIITETQHKYGIIDRDIAGYVLAFEKKIRIKKYLDDATMQKVQDAMQKRSTNTDTPRTKNTNHEAKSPVIKIGNEFDIDHPVLPTRILTEARKMADVYPYIYLFENSVRNVILVVMGKKYGDTWWPDKVSTKIKGIVSSRMATDKKNKWHGRRGAHPIFYSDIDHLGNIITTYWKDFEPYFPSLSWITAKLEIIETSRNVVSHNNPLSEDDIASVKLNFKQWTKQIKDFEPE